MSFGQRYMQRMVAANNRMQERFAAGMMAARGFAANPKLLGKAVSDWRAARRRRTLERWERFRRLELARGGRDPGKRMTIRMWWNELCEGTEVVFRPVLNPVRRRVARARDFARSFVPTLPRVRQEKPQPRQQQKQQPQSAPFSNMLVTVQESGRALRKGATSLGQHFQELMLDPNFKRRQLAHNIRKWEPKTRAGRVMAPFGLALGFFIPVATLIFITIADAKATHQRRLEEARQLSLQRADPSDTLGISEDKRRSRSRNEDDVLLEIFSVRRA